MFSKETVINEILKNKKLEQKHILSIFDKILTNF